MLANGEKTVKINKTFAVTGRKKQGRVKNCVICSLHEAAKPKPLGPAGRAAEPRGETAPDANISLDFAHVL